MERDRSVRWSISRDIGDLDWPPYAPVEGPVDAFVTAGRASATCVRRPWVRVGRWTVLYRRAA